jgi:hypothetical protein
MRAGVDVITPLLRRDGQLGERAILAAQVISVMAT